MNFKSHETNFFSNSTLSVQLNNSYTYIDAVVVIVVAVVMAAAAASAVAAAAAAVVVGVGVVGLVGAFVIFVAFVVVGHITQNLLRMLVDLLNSFNNKDFYWSPKI